MTSSPMYLSMIAFVSRSASAEIQAKKLFTYARVSVGVMLAVRSEKAVMSANKIVAFSSRPLTANWAPHPSSRIPSTVSSEAVRKSSSEG